MSPKVSVIMPVYNMEQYVAESIESVIAQDYTNWELLIVDDGSKDTSAQICSRYLHDERIKYFYKSNGGLPSARNFAIDRAAGELLALLDSDDLWTPNKLGICVQEFDSGSQDLLFSSVYRFSKSSQLHDLAKLQKFEVGDRVYEGVSAIKDFILGNKILVPSVVVKKTVIQAIGGFPPFSFGEDYCTWLMLLCENYKFRTINDSLSFYRVRDDSMYHSAQNRYILDFKVLDHIVKKYPHVLGLKKELVTFLNYYLAIEYDRTKIDEVKAIMTAFQLKNTAVEFLLSNSRFLPRRVASKLMRSLMLILN